MAHKNVVITGGISGIGRALVIQTQKNGDTPIVIDYLNRDNESVKELVNSGALYVSADVSSADSVKIGFEQIDKYLSNASANLSKKIDVLINNAGITRDGLALRLSEADWDTVLAVNLKGSFLCAQQALKRMIRQEKSYIINIASVVGIYGNAGQANYAASKAGIIALTRTLAQEYAVRKVLVNAIAPGFIQTAMTDRLTTKIKEVALSRIALKRFGTPQEVALLASFLTSGFADYITGQVIALDGGMF
jgi:3-oxoacyl-[acyl-carrier protein] reductase